MFTGYGKLVGGSQIKCFQPGHGLSMHFVDKILTFDNENLIQAEVCILVMSANPLLLVFTVLL